MPLTGGEYDLLVALVERANRVLTRDMLLDLLRGRQAGPFDRAIDVAVCRLRRKLEDDGRNAAADQDGARRRLRAGGDGRAGMSDAGRLRRRLLARLLPRSLAARTALVLLAGLVVVQVAGPDDPCARPDRPAAARRRRATSRQRGFSDLAHADGDRARTPRRDAGRTRPAARAARRLRRRARRAPDRSRRRRRRWSAADARQIDHRCALPRLPPAGGVVSGDRPARRDAGRHAPAGWRLAEPAHRAAAARGPGIRRPSWSPSC